MWKYFIFITLLEIILDFSSSDMNKCIIRYPKIIPIQIFHHVIDCFLLFGWMFDNVNILSVHVLACVGIMLHWYWQKDVQNLCFLTVEVNKLCKWPKDKPFNDFVAMLGLKNIPNWNTTWSYLLVLIIVSISLYKIYRAKAKRQ